jgi:hypothetical protein
MQKLSLSVLPNSLAVCQLKTSDPVPDWIFSLPFWSITHTLDEISIVLPLENVLPGWKAETGWRGIKILGPLDFSLTGVLVSIANPLAQAGISIFAISTFDTDYLLVKADNLSRTIEILSRHGCDFI